VDAALATLLLDDATFGVTDVHTMFATFPFDGAASLSPLLYLTMFGNTADFAIALRPQFHRD